MNKELIEDYMNRVWNKKDLSKVDEIFSESAVIHSPLGRLKTPKEMRETIEKWLTAIPDIHVTFLHMIEENDIVISHWNAKGTHEKEFRGIQSQNHSIDYQGVSMYRLEDGKVVEYWAFIDGWTLENQMK